VGQKQVIKNWSSNQGGGGKRVDKEFQLCEEVKNPGHVGRKEQQIKNTTLVDQHKRKKGGSL